MSAIVMGTGFKLAKSILSKRKQKGNFLGKAKAFASKLSEKLGSEDESMDAMDLTDAANEQQTKGLFGGESKKEREQREAAEAAASEAAKKKNNMLLMVAAAIVLFMFMKKK